MTTPATRLGYLHIQKCMGTSLTSAIASALGLRHRSFFSFPDLGLYGPEHVVKPHIITPIERHRWSRSSFVAGHLSIDALVSLDRQVIFTNVREPRERLLSHYTFWRQRALLSQSPAPAVAQTRTMTPSQYLSRPHLDNVMARQFLVGRGYEEEGLEDPDTSMLMRSREGDLRRRLRWQLARIDVLYVDVSPNDVVIDLAERRILPEAPPVQRLNTTERQRVDLDCGRDEFLALLEERTWADRIVLEEVLQHPGLVRGTAPRGAESDEELLNSFGIVLTP